MQQPLGKICVLVGVPILREPPQRFSPTRSEDGLGIEAYAKIHVTRAELRGIQAARVCGITDHEQQEGRHVDLFVLVALANVQTFASSPFEVEDLLQHRVMRTRVTDVHHPERFPTRSRSRQVHRLGHACTVVQRGTSARGWVALASTARCWWTCKASRTVGGMSARQITLSVAIGRVRRSARVCSFSWVRPFEAWIFVCTMNGRLGGRAWNGLVRRIPERLITTIGSCP